MKVVEGKKADLETALNNVLPCLFVSLQNDCMEPGDIQNSCVKFFVEGISLQVSERFVSSLRNILLLADLLEISQGVKKPQDLQWHMISAQFWASDNEVIQDDFSGLQFLRKCKICDTDLGQLFRVCLSVLALGFQGRQILNAAFQMM